MRELRPEFYSDTKEQAAYILDETSLGYHLESITSLNETNNFEIFCRKLCERTICPNLRPHTGPDGGGDSKADVETYPVAEEIAELFYIGNPNQRRERWAFAFSAQKTWSTKIRKDVKGIIETERNYERIFFVTSRFTRDKDRARIEDELSNKYDTPVIILDRKWIIKEIIENDRKDIAFNYLGVGKAKSDPLRLGPSDYSRTQQLSEIEKLIDDPEAFQGMKQQLVTESIVAAKLSRNMERPRTETDGRFLRAIRLADRYGVYRQKLEAKYEHIWTAFWWFDDFQFLNDSYDSFESLAISTDVAINLEFLCNLNQLLFNSVLFEHMSREECKLDERTSNLKHVLTKIAQDKNRPNNSLEAETSLLIIEMNQAMLDENSNKLADVWSSFATIFDKADGLGEFKAERVVSMVEIAGNVAGNNPSYNVLVEKMAEFVTRRKSEAEGALILLRRAEKLDFNDNFEMIRLLGKAAISLTKKEYTDYLIEALKLLTLAYRSAGLLWAARASCVFLAASLIMEGEEDSYIPIDFVPTMKVWAWISLELRHLPDFLFAIQMLNGALATLQLTDESKSKLKDDIFVLDAALGSLFLNLESNELNKLENIPDILDQFGLFISRAALMYILGYEDVLRVDGSIPDNETEADVNHMYSILASQPVAANLYGPIILNDDEERQVRETNILGMKIEIRFENSLLSTIVAEAVLGTLEAFLATTIELHVMPHTEKLRINLVESDDKTQPIFEMNELDMEGDLIWPHTLSPTNYGDQKSVHSSFTEVSGHVLAASCIVKDIKNLLEKLYDDEAVHNRMAMVAFSSNSYHRVASKYISSMTDWNYTVQNSYELRAARPKLTHVEFKCKNNSDEDEVQEKSDQPPDLKDHRKLKVRSVIDIHAWDLARWKGTAYGQFGSDYPPFLAFIFENADGGKKIFEHWIHRFGNHDKNEDISLSIVRRLPQRSVYHYCVVVSSKIPEHGEFKPNQMFAMATRSMVMEPDNDVNLEGFLVQYQKFKAYYLMPALLNESGTPEILFDLAILKRNLIIKLAENVGKHDIESVALREY